MGDEELNWNCDIFEHERLEYENVATIGQHVRSICKNGGHRTLKLINLSLIVDKDQLPYCYRANSGMRIFDDKGESSITYITPESAKAAALVREETDAMKINSYVACSIEIFPYVPERLSDLHNKPM
jgi:hypothetical protein